MPWMLCESLRESVWSGWHSIGYYQLVSDVGTVSEVGEGGVVTGNIKCPYCNKLLKIAPEHENESLVDLRCSLCNKNNLERRKGDRRGKSVITDEDKVLMKAMKVGI